MIRILTNDGLQQGAVDKLVSMGFKVVNTHYDKDVLGEVLKDFDVLVIRSATKITADILDAEEGGKLKLIIRAGVGIDNIDVNYATEKGIIVKNTPNASSDSVAELAIGHMFAVARFLGVSNYTMRNGQWNKKKYEGIELGGKTLGIIGMGRIGRALATKATALGMNVVYNDIFGKQNNLSYDFLEFDDLLKKSDFISLHVPYDKNKGSLIGKNEIEKMKDGQVIVTTEVVTSSLNYYGNAHGGYLFTLCDQISGLVLISQGLDGVTLQSSINYLRAGHAGDKLTISGTCVHPGRKTRVVDVVISNQEKENVCKATFTMFVTGQRKEESQINI